MTRLAIFLLLLPMASAQGTTLVAAEDSPNLPLIGYLSAGSGQDPLRQLFLRGLEELGYVQGKNFRFEYRSAKGKRDRLPALAAELVGLNPAVIVPSGPTAAGPLLKATQTIPIVMPNASSDPVKWGFVKSLSQPGGNVTGISIGEKGLGSKRMELLKEALPAIRHVVFLNPHQGPTYLEEYRQVAKTLDFEFEAVDVRSDGDIEQAFAKAATLRSGAVLVERNTLTLRNADKIGELALKHRIPTMNNQRIFVEKEGLMSYGVSYPANWRRAAVLVDKILKGAKPATIPVEPPQLELVVNLKTAAKLGTTIPPEILLEAYEVIK